MKKKKLTLFANVAVLILCLCAIVVGVYSAKNANLNVSGTVGFNAHNCDVDVTVYIYGDSAVEDTSTAEASELGVVRSSSSKKQLGTAQVKGDTNKTISLGNFYFCDMTADDTISPIYIVFELTNQSMFDVDVSATTTFTPANENVTPVSSTVTLKDKSAETADKKKELIVTLTLSPTTSSVKDTTITITLNMNKAQTQIKGSTAEVCYSEFKTQKSDLYSIYHELESNDSTWGIDDFLDALNNNQKYFDSTNFDAIYDSVYNKGYNLCFFGTIFAEDSLCLYIDGANILADDYSGGLFFLSYNSLPQKNSNDLWNVSVICEDIKDRELSDFKILALNFETYNFVLYGEDGDYDFSYDTAKTGLVEFTCEQVPFMGLLLTLE